MGSASFKLTNAPEFHSQMERNAAQVTHDLASAMYQVSEEIMTDSKENYCPVDVGALRASGHVELPEVTARVITVEMGYGGPAEAYAVIQHERLDFRHTVGEAKFLEKPALKAQARLEGRIAAAMRSSGGSSSTSAA